MSDPNKSRDLNGFFEFGAYRLEGPERRLLKDGESILLQPKVFDTLLLLVENAGHVVTKSELMSTLWPETAVEEGNLTKNIWLIRRAIGEAEGENHYIETVPRVGYRFVAPVRRVEDLPPADEPPPAIASRSRDDAFLSETEAARGRRPIGWVVGAVAVLVVGFGASLIWISRRSRPGGSGRSAIASTAGFPGRRSVAVLGFQNLSRQPESDWLSTAVSEMISAEIGAGENLRLIPADGVARLEGVRYPTTTGTLSQRTLARIRTTLDADLVLSGSYVVIASAGGDALRFDMTVQNAASGETLAAVTETGSEDDLFKLVSSAGGKLRTGLGLAATSRSEAASVAAALPKNLEAARLYAEGLRKLRADDALGARPLLDAAIRAAPDFAPTHEALSRVWSALGYDRNAAEEAKNSFRLALA
ncbi:MAG: winged helix-turn-helix domain-containing protein, partial [Thermoanaerobaculia bacterium]